jgi:gag-polypeptide of LTR copia-type
MQSITDRLCGVGSNMSDQDLVLYMLQGLGSECRTFITVFSMHSIATSMTEFQSLLLVHEARLQTSLPMITASSAHLNTSSMSNDNSTRVAFHTSTPSSKQYQSNSYNRGLPILLFDHNVIGELIEVVVVVGTIIIPLNLPVRSVSN